MTLPPPPPPPACCEREGEICCCVDIFGSRLGADDVYVAFVVAVDFVVFVIVAAAAAAFDDVDIGASDVGVGGSGVVAGPLLALAVVAPGTGDIVTYEQQQKTRRKTI